MCQIILSNYIYQNIYLQMQEVAILTNSGCVHGQIETIKNKTFLDFPII